MKHLGTAIGQLENKGITKEMLLPSDINEIYRKEEIPGALEGPAKKFLLHQYSKVHFITQLDVDYMT